MSVARTSCVLLHYFDQVLTCDHTCYGVEFICDYQVPETHRTEQAMYFLSARVGRHTVRLAIHRLSDVKIQIVFMFPDISNDVFHKSLFV